MSSFFEIFKLFFNRTKFWLVRLLFILILFSIVFILSEDLEILPFIYSKF